jgi:hypothetical protein
MLLKQTIIALGATFLISYAPAFAEEDCFNGPNGPFDGAQRANITVPAGHAVRLTFNFNAAWETQVYVCDALTGHRILEKGNYRHNREDWLSPIDDTKTLSYFIVAMHKNVPETDENAFRRPWIQSLLKQGVREPVAGEAGSYVDSYGFNDGGGKRWDNALVTAYVIGVVHETPGPVPGTTLQSIQSKLTPQ